ncbi:Alpha-(1-_3)-arabinofuranosyltransferase [Corynebacterium lowii]|uniref:Alpha-(1->3)-arabinofuranosyltransferase n=1 Tax=Corynebacterium lowii TaxID=1544413 RepID=A0A0Q0U3L9_9CORY|nr:Alpha-(1->3)-arabinofuranosyltransferase [Corynebacterium lowii]
MRVPVALRSLQHRLDNTFVAQRPISAAPPRLPGGPRWLSATLWLFALFSWLRLLIFDAPAHKGTDDFSTVFQALRRFLDGSVVYNESYQHVDPHYLYNPGATLLLSPFAFGNAADAARTWFMVANAVAIIVALLWLARLFHIPSGHWFTPLALMLASLTEAARSTVLFNNINGILLLLLVAFISLTLRDRQVAAGIMLGLGIVVKPLFAPLLVLALVKFQWRTIASALAVVLALNAVAWPLMNQPERYFTVVTPYLGEVRDYANSSLPGLAMYFGMPTALYTALFCVVAACVALSAVVLLRWRHTDPLLWLVTSSSLIFTGVFLLSSLGQKYYSLLLLPLLFTVTQARSVLHHWLPWVGIYLFLGPQGFPSDSWYTQYILVILTAPVGWAILLLSATGTILGWWRSESTPPPQPPQQAPRRARHGAPQRNNLPARRVTQHRRTPRRRHNHD